MTSVECPVCFEEFNEENIMICHEGGHAHACITCLSMIPSDNCSLCRRRLFINEDSDDEPVDYLDDSDNIYGINSRLVAPRRIVNTYDMTEDTPIWWKYEVHFDEEGNQEEVYIVNESGKILQSGKHIFFHEDDCDTLILKDEDFEDNSWIKVEHIIGYHDMINYTSII